MIENWEKEFENNYYEYFLRAGYEKGLYPDMKKFISDLLLSQEKKIREEILEKLPKRKSPRNGDNNGGINKVFNSCLEQVKEIISKK